MFLQSIRFKIILWYMLILAVTLSLFSFFLYHNLNNILNSNNDALLLSKAEGVADSIETYLQAKRLKTGNIDFTDLARRWVDERSKDPKLMNNIVQIFDSQGKQISSSRNLPAVNTLSQEMLDFALRNVTTFDDLSLEVAQGKITNLRVLTMPMVEKGKTTYIIQVASPLDYIYYVLMRLRIILFIILPLTIFLSGIAGVFLAKIALRPIDKIVKNIHQITAHNLQSKISVPETNDEIQSLAETFNELLVRLHEAFLLQRQFIQDISHELKTPLTILKGELEVALKKARLAEEYESILASNLEEINKISQIIENLLNLARFESKEVKLQIKPVPLKLLLGGILEDIRILAEQKDITLDFFAAEEVTIRVDEQQIKRAILNILDNAIKYTPQQGRVSLELSKEREFAKIKIKDTGVGISQSDLAHIFDRFYRSDKSRSSLGFGLGLSISKAIIEAHKGKTEVQSRISQGSSFTIFLPFYNA